MTNAQKTRIKRLEKKVAQVRADMEFAKLWIAEQIADPNRWQARCQINHVRHLKRKFPDLNWCAVPE